MRVKTDARRRAILDAAAEVFQQSGYASASMSAVAERIGGSKATLYRYFPSKEALFAQLMLEAVMADAAKVFDVLRPTDDLRSTLTRFGAGLLKLSLGEKSLSVRRNAIAEGPRAGLGQELNERGSKVLWSKMAGFLSGEMAAGRVRRAEPWMAAMHLRGLLEADLINRALIGADVDRRPANLRRHAEAAVDAFLRAYAQTSSDSSAIDTPPSTGIVAPTT